jgi:hypothetical protein
MLAMTWNHALDSSLQRGLAALTLALASSTTLLAATPSTYAERLHARAVESFRQGRFPQAYGRFINLANAGHPASARYALWMCEQGPTLFGKDWDCAPHEVEDWNRLGSQAMPKSASLPNQVPSQPLVLRRR